MIVAELLAALRDRGIHLWREGSALRYDAPRGALDPDLAAVLRAAKADLLAVLPDREPARAPLSPGQQRLWFLQQLDPDDPFLNVVGALRVRGALDEARLRGALRGLVARHEQLRTTIERGAGGTPCQVVRAPGDAPEIALEVLEMTGTPETEREEEIRRAALGLGARTVPLGGPLARGRLLSFAPEDHGLVLVLHHIVCDFWSFGVMLRDLLALFESETAVLPPLPRFASVAAECDVAERDAALAHWARELAGAPPTDLPIARPRPARKSYRAHGLRHRLGATIARDVAELARATAVTPFAVLLAAFASTLQRFGAGSDLVVGTDVAVRPGAGSEHVVGFLVNQLPLRLRPREDEPFRSLVRAAAAVAAGALEHRAVPFQRVVERVALQRVPGRHPLFDVGFTLQNAPPIAAQGALDLRPVDLPVTAVQLDLELVAELRGEELVLQWRFAADLFDAAVAARLADGFETLLRHALGDPDAPAGALRAVPVPALAELDRLGSGRTAPVGELFDAALERAARENPERVALRDEHETLSYAELLHRVDAAAAALAAHGAGPGEVVGVLLPRGAALLSAMLGAMRLGAAYLPLDPRQPPARLMRMVRRAGCRLVVADGDGGALAETGSVVLGAAVLRSSAPSAVPRTAASPGDPAYVLFTSGSTGEPKGALVRHDGMMNHLRAKVDELALGPADVVLQTASQAFDISVWQFLAPLLAGARVEVVPDDVVAHPRRLLAAAAASGATVLQTVPSMLAHVLAEDGAAAPPSLRVLISTGEALPPEVARRWFALALRVPILNAYGPAECSDDVTHAWIAEPPGPEVRHLPIGRPLRNARLAVVNRFGEPVPRGAPGELRVAGIPVGLGYVNDPGATAAAFVPDGPDGVAGARAYRTGDLVRWNEAGELEFLGRRDHQVKVHGTRIDCGEVEAALMRCRGVREALVTAVPGRESAVLAAYVVPAGERPPEAELRGEIAALLPRAMIPARFVWLDRLPQTANGKVDRAALPAVPEAAGSGAVRPARTSAELFVRELWSELLGVEPERIAADGDFFELGGHSIAAARMTGLLEERLGLRVPVGLIFEHPVLAAYARQVDAQGRG